MMTLLFFRERAKDLMPPGQESLMILVDYKSTTLRTNPSISVARKVLTILQHHYVETLGRAVVVNLPTILSFFYKGIAPFLDPVTREKMRFNPDLFELVPRGQLDADFGGDYQYEFDHETYWNQLIQYVSPYFRFISARGTAWSSSLLKLAGHAASRLMAHA
jgi:CRAL/TRIO domain